MIECGMRQQDWMVFLQAAKRLNKWILVRWTNPASLKYIDRKSLRFRYGPKPIDCKAKTADLSMGGKEQAGLVVCPWLVRQVYKNSDKAQKAEKAWNQFVASRGGGSSSEDFNQRQIRTAGLRLYKPLNMGAILRPDVIREAVDIGLLHDMHNGRLESPRSRLYLIDRDRSSPHFGCLTLNGWYLYGDYDLKDVIDPRAPHHLVAVESMLHDSRHMSAPDIAGVIEYLNTQIGVPMVQHSPEALWAGHSEDTIEVFSPFGNVERLHGRAEIERWYGIVFAGRTPNERRGVFTSPGATEESVSNALPRETPGNDDLAIPYPRHQTCAVSGVILNS